MRTKENNEFKNSTFPEKQKEYVNSELWITNSLKDIPDLNIEEKNKRQEELANIAVKVWALKFN